MAARVDVKINTNQLNRAMQEVQRRVERVASEEIEAAINQGIATATVGFKNAVYDGSTDDIRVYAEKNGPRTWTLVAEGEAVEFIEYGTGAQAHSGYINPTTKKPYWFFSAKGRNIKLNAHGKPARYTYRRTTKEKPAKYFAIVNGRQQAVDANLVKNGKYSTGVGQPALIGGRLVYRQYKEVPVQKVEGGIEKVPSYLVDLGPRNDGVYVTSGNPPNMVMEEVREKMAAYIYRQFSARFK